ncbi:MAG: hypothetical protein ABLT11_04465 [Candidatus Acidiferrum sp.]
MLAFLTYCAIDTLHPNLHLGQPLGIDAAGAPPGETWERTTAGT